MTVPPFRILYEDSALIFVDKAPGIVVQRGYDPDEPVLFELVAKYLEARGERPFLLQRLDRGTSGVLFFSKQANLNRALTRRFEKKEIIKRYLALCEGRLTSRQTIDAPLARIGPISFGVRDDGKRAVTTIRPLASSADASLVELRLMTGRTHQIRVHCAAVGNPLVGDWLYGERNEGRPMLHSASLAMSHPESSLPLNVVAPLPEDFIAEVIRRGIDPGIIDDAAPC